MSEEKTRCRCDGCGFTGEPSSFDASMSPYHDLRCPKCKTTAVDTSELNESWKKDGERYGYGDHNVLSFE